MGLEFFVLFIMGHPQEVSLKVLWRSDLIWQRYLGTKNVHLFVYGFDYFCFNHHGTAKGSFPESFVKIRLDLAEVFRILKSLFDCLLFIGLFAFLF